MCFEKHEYVCVMNMLMTTETFNISISSSMSENTNIIHTFESFDSALPLVERLLDDLIQDVQNRILCYIY